MFGRPERKTTRLAGPPTRRCDLATAILDDLLFVFHLTVVFAAVARIALSNRVPSPRHMGPYPVAHLPRWNPWAV